MSSEPAARLIVIDWGTTSLRLWAVDEAGRTLAERRLPQGVMSIAPGGFGAVFAAAVAGMRESDSVPVLMSGMVGSRQGWAEAPYLPCPASLPALADALLPAPGERHVFIVPGLSVRRPGHADVMRGEETQILGLAPFDGLAVLPGTHSKWARVAGDRILSFRTIMTGELYALLRQHSILSRLMRDGEGFDAAAFDAGIAAARAHDDGLSVSLFGVRALGLFGELSESAAPDYLSGLLIGHEIRDCAGLFPTRSVAVVGAGPLVERYCRALAAFGIAAARHGEDAGRNGLLTIARAAGLLG